jgi:hypothetical protein
MVHPNVKNHRLEFGDEAKGMKITKGMLTRWEDDTGVSAAVAAAAEKLKNI